MHMKLRLKLHAPHTSTIAIRDFPNETLHHIALKAMKNGELRVDIRNAEAVKV